MLQIMAYATAAIDKLGTIVYEHAFHPPEHVAQEWIARCRRQLAGALRCSRKFPRSLISWASGSRRQTSRPAR